MNSCSDDTSCANWSRMCCIWQLSHLSLKCLFIFISYIIKSAIIIFIIYIMKLTGWLIETKWYSWIFSYEGQIAELIVVDKIFCSDWPRREWICLKEVWTSFSQEVIQAFLSSFPSQAIPLNFSEPYFSLLWSSWRTCKQVWSAPKG